MTKIRPTTASNSSSSDSEVEQRPPSQQHGRESRHSSPPQNDTDFQMFINAVDKLWLQIKQVFNYIMNELGGYLLFEKFAQWCVRNPHIALCLIAGGLAIMLPSLILLGFGIATVLMTFTGFLVLEGTLLTIVSMLLFGCLCLVVFVAFMFFIVSIAIYFGFTQVYDLYGGINRHKTALLNFLQNEGNLITSMRSTNRTAIDGEGETRPTRNNNENL